MQFKLGLPALWAGSFVVYAAFADIFCKIIIKKRKDGIVYGTEDGNYI